MAYVPPIFYFLFQENDKERDGERSGVQEEGGSLRTPMGTG